MYIVFSEKCLEYWEPGHPESPERVYAINRLLRKKDFQFIEPQPCVEDDLRLVHSRDFVERIRKGGFSDGDTADLPGMYDYAKLSVGAAIKSMEIAIEGEKAFSLMRPPGHHAGINGRALGASSLGFCYFNNIAIACIKALNRIEKMAIIDIDCHHGNGTQEIIFGKPGTLYVSLHRHGDAYPGTGSTSERNCINFLLRPTCADAGYLKALESALKEVEMFNPNVIGVSAGFDTYRHDPVCGLGLSEEAYGSIGRMIGRLEKRTFAVLEGGYGDQLPACVFNFLGGLEQRE